jgi:hypothetical protein
MFTESLSIFLGDFGVPASFKPPAGTWTFDGGPTFDSVTYTFDGSTTYSAKVIFDTPETGVLGNRANSVNYEITYQTLQLPGLRNGSTITVKGNPFVVIDTNLIDDGTFSKARIEV